MPLDIFFANLVAQGLAFLAVSMLVAELIRALQVEYDLRRTDSLTGLPNRAAFFERAEACLLLCSRSGRAVSMAFIDLNDFKRVNDSLGHAHGDKVLKECGRLLVAAIRETDIAARLGGDEFVIFLPNTDEEASTATLDRLHTAFASSLELQAACVEASIGIVVDEAARSSIADLLERADARMYSIKRAAKTGGRGFSANLSADA